MRKVKRPITSTASTVARATGRRPSVFPAHLHSTPEEWRAVKRQEWREVQAALARFMYGAAYAPAWAELHKLTVLANQIEDMVMAEGWVAW